MTTQQRKTVVIRGIVLSLLINGFAPWLIYTLLTSYTHTTELLALQLTSVPSIIDSIVGIVRQRRIDFMAGVSLLSIVMSLIFIALGGDPKLYLVRGSLFGIGFSLAVLVSFVFPKPLTYYTLRFFVTGNNEHLMQDYEKKWQQDAGWRWMLRVQAVLWGVGLLIEGGARIWLVFALPVAQFLIVSPIVFYGFYGGLMILSMACGFVFQRHIEKLKRQQELATSHSNE